MLALGVDSFLGLAEFEEELVSARGFGEARVREFRGELLEFRLSVYFPPSRFLGFQLFLEGLEIGGGLLGDPGDELGNPRGGF